MSLHFHKAITNTWRDDLEIGVKDNRSVRIDSKFRTGWIQFLLSAELACYII